MLRFSNLPGSPSFGAKTLHHYATVALIGQTELKANFYVLL